MVIDPYSLLGIGYNRQCAVQNAFLTRNSEVGYIELIFQGNVTRYYSVPKRPLDERFADFKMRLAAALAKRVNRENYVAEIQRDN